MTTYSYGLYPIWQFFNNGVPVAGGQLFFYQAGTTTKQNAYSNNSGTPISNPCILDSQGRPTTNGTTITPVFLQVGQSYKFVLAPSTDTDPPTSPLWTADNQSIASAALTSTLFDTNNNPVIETSATVNPVNQFTASAALTGSGPTLAATGTDSNIPIILNYKGTSFVDTRQAFGQCRLAVTSTTSIVLSPYNGNLLTINDHIYQIPNAGITVTNSGLAANTLYYIYAYMNSGTMTLEAVTTAYATGTVAQIKIKSGDVTRTLVGMCLTNGSAQFVDAAATRYLVNWFNRRLIVGQNNFTTNRSTMSTTPVEVNSEIRTGFILWADGDNVQASISGSATSAGTYSVYTWLDINGLSALDGGTITGYDSKAGPIGVTATVYSLNEGYNYFTLVGAVSSAGTAVWLGGSAGAGTIGTTTIYVTFMG